MSTNSRPKKKRCYKERFRHEDPFVSAPKTTKWRLRKLMQSASSEVIQNQTTVHGHNHGNNDEHSECLINPSSPHTAEYLPNIGGDMTDATQSGRVYSDSSRLESEPDVPNIEVNQTMVVEEEKEESSLAKTNTVGPAATSSSLPTFLQLEPADGITLSNSSSSSCLHAVTSLPNQLNLDKDEPVFKSDKLSRIKVSIDACRIDPSSATNTSSCIDEQFTTNTAVRACIDEDEALMYSEQSQDHDLSIENGEQQDPHNCEVDQRTGLLNMNTASYPLFPDSQISTSESALLTLTFSLRHDLSGEGISDLLKLIEVHCPSQNSCSTSLYKLRNHFKGPKSPVRCHRFCSSCNMFIGDDKSISTCHNCGKVYTPNEDMPYFLEIPIVDQLKNMFTRSHFHHDLLHRFCISAKSTGSISDIYDGTLYKQFCQPGGFLSNKNNISLMWYVDGAQLFKSSKGSLWVLYFAINELPYNKRMNPDNIILGGLWFNDGKPCMSSFLKPFCESLNDLYSAGCDVFCGHCQKEIHINAMVLCGTCDLPAKSAVMNMTQFNGQYGCPKCCQPGKVVAAGRGHTRVYPFDVENIDGPLRTNKGTIEEATEANVTGKPVQGIKGPSWFSTLNDYDLIQGTGIDYMHGVLLGVVRQLLKLWFASKYSSEPFSCSKVVDAIDERLLQIRPPSFISRLPRSIKSHLTHWKANECRAWLLFYSVPVLCGILPDEYYQHHLLLVEAIHKLCKDEILPAELVHCRRLLIHFVATFGALYSDRHMTINIHQLLHLVDVVHNLGPLWVYSCFSFESLNGKLLKLVHGANKPVLQIANAVTNMLRIPELGEKLGSNSKAAGLYKHFRGRGSKHSSAVEIEPNIYILGKLKKSSNEEYHRAARFPDVAFTSLYTFMRVQVNNQLVCCSQYVALKSRVCSVVMLQDNSFARVEVFVKCCSCECADKCNCESTAPKYFALVRNMYVANCTEVGLCRDDLTDASLPQYQLVHSLSKTLVAIPIGFIKEECVNVCVGMGDKNLPDLEFLVVPPNCHESD